MREIIDLPRVFLKATAIDWTIDWRSRSAGRDTGGGDQVAVTGFPQIVGNLPLVIPRVMLGEYRAIVWRARGRINALRVPMIDPATLQLGGARWQDQWRAYLAGTYIEARPTVPAISAAAAGDSTIVIDERGLRAPVRIGSFLSYLDRPFGVVGRSGPIEARVLSVERLAVGIPAGGLIDVAARGVFLLPDDRSGQPSYGLTLSGSADLQLTEWITR